MFQAKCNSDEAVVIQTALYGRMNIGRCVTRNYGNIGCAIEVKSLLDEKCSGRHSCEVRFNFKYDSSYLFLSFRIEGTLGAELRIKVKITKCIKMAKISRKKGGKSKIELYLKFC